MTRRLAPLAITHQGLFPATTISFNLAQGASLGEGVAALHRAEQRIGLPDTVQTNLGGGGGRIRLLAGQRGRAGRGCDPDGLHRAGRAVRELHPPGHHPVHPAIRRGGRVRGADAGRAWSWI